MATTAMDASGEPFVAMDFYELQGVVTSLKRFPMREIGGALWTKQQTALSKLNVQAHLHVQQGNEQVVVDAIYTEDKMKVLVHELLAIEQWKKEVYPMLAKDLLTQDTVKTYFILYHEAVLINLMEVLFFHPHVIKSTGDALVDLVDYCMRKMAYLSSIKHARDDAVSLDLDEKSYLDKMKNEMEFALALGSLSVFRYMTDMIHELPLNVMDRMLHRNDMICGCVDLIEKAPWIKRTKKGIQVFEDNAWKQGEMERVTKVEAQVWLCLYNLLMEPECRKVFQYDERSYETIQKLRPYFHENLTNQLPVVEMLWRHLEELAIVKPHLSAPRVRPVIEEVPEITAKLMDELKDKKALVKECKQKMFSTDKAALAKQLAEVYSPDALEPLLEDPKCASCGQLATNRCSSCKSEWYCGRPCQVKAWKSHKPICAMLSKAK